MAQVIDLVRASRLSGNLDLLRPLIVAGCALVLIVAGNALPF